MNEYLEEEDELPPLFCYSIEEYWDNWKEVNDRPCDLHGLLHCSTCLFGGNDNPSEPIRNQKGIENEEYSSEET